MTDHTNKTPTHLAVSIFLCILIGISLLVGMGYSIGLREAELVRVEAEKAGVGEFYLDDKRVIRFRWKTATPEKNTKPQQEATPR